LSNIVRDNFLWNTIRSSRLSQELGLTRFIQAVEEKRSLVNGRSNGQQAKVLYQKSS
jgi:hypothetical protein